MKHITSFLLIKISYKNLFYNILLSNNEFYKFNFLKKHGTLYSLLGSLLTNKASINSANVDQISFIIDLIHGYDRGKLIDTGTVMDISYSPSDLQHGLLTRAQRILLDTKKNLNKGIRNFLPQKFR